MKKEDFRNQVATAALKALRLGEGAPDNRLSTNLYYVLILNEPFYEGYNGEVKIYSEDKRKVFLCATENQIVDILFRDGRYYPLWINIAVAGSDKDQTLICLNCSRYYLSDEAQTQYYHQGAQPFRIKPPIPLENWKLGRPLKNRKGRRVVPQILSAILNAQKDPIVIDRNGRDLLAERLRQYLSGQICNYDLSDLGIGIGEYDYGVGAIQWLAWHFYDDLSEHKAVGEYKIPDDVRHILVRCICFLHTNCTCSEEDLSDVDLSEWDANGICWPFASKEQYETAMQNPKLLSGKETKDGQAAV